MTFDEFSDRIWLLLKGNPELRLNTCRQLWAHGTLVSDRIETARPLHAVYARTMHHEIVEFLRDAHAFCQRTGAPGATRDIFAHREGKRSTDGATYGVALGLLRRSREKGGFTYQPTPLGLAVLAGRRRLPERFVIFEMSVVAVSFRTLSFQEAMGRGAGRVLFTGQRAALFRVTGSPKRNTA